MISTTQPPRQKDFLCYYLYTVSLIVSERRINPLSPLRIAIFPTLSHQAQSFSKDICSGTSVRLKERREV